MLQTGEKLNNRYVVMELFKKGKVSDIYLIEDQETGKTCLLKDFYIQIRNPHQLKAAGKKFEKDVIMLAGFHHPALPQFGDYFISYGRQMLVMEKIEGRSLAQLIDDCFAPIYEPDAIAIAVQIADALDFLHTQKEPMLFRQLRPSHIMITLDERIKLIDFDLGRHFKSISEPRDKKIGFPGHAPPEQFAKDIFSERTDIYALGAILHQMLTLRDPSALVNAFKFPPPSSINEKISWELDGIVEKATAQEPEDRYATAAEFKKVLEAYLIRKELLEKSQRISEKKTRTAERKTVEMDAGTIRHVEIERIEKSVHEEQEKKISSRSGAKHGGSHFAPIKQPKPEKKTADKKSSKARQALVNKTLGMVTMVLLAILAILFILKSVMDHRKINNASVSKKSPYSLIEDRKIMEMRQKGIDLYKQGYKDKDNIKISSAVQHLTKAVYANPADVECQVYWENCHVLLKGRPYFRVAALLPLTGDNFEAGCQMLAGINLVQQMHNKKMEQKPILVEIYDYKSLLEEAVRLAVELAGDKNILAVIGPVRSLFLMNTSQYFNQSQTVQIAPSGVCADVENLGDYIFRTSGDGKYLGIKMAEFATGDLKLKRIAVVHDLSDPYSNVIGKIFLKRAEENSSAELEAFTMNLDSKSYSDVMEKLKEYNPDGVFFVGYHQHQPRFAAELKKAGINAVHMTTVAAYSDQLITSGGESVEGIVFQSFFLPGSQFSKQKEFEQLYVDKFEVEPNYRSAMAYDSMLAVTTAIEQGVTTSQELRSFLVKDLGDTCILGGATGRVSFDTNGCRREITLFPVTVKEGKFVLFRK